MQLTKLDGGNAIFLLKRTVESGIIGKADQTEHRVIECFAKQQGIWLDAALDLLEEKNGK